MNDIDVINFLNAKTSSTASGVEVRKTEIVVSLSSFEDDAISSDIFEELGKTKRKISIAYGCLCVERLN